MVFVSYKTSTIFYKNIKFIGNSDVLNLTLVGLKHKNVFLICLFSSWSNFDNPDICIAKKIIAFSFWTIFVFLAYTFLKPCVLITNCSYKNV